MTSTRKNKPHMRSILQLKKGQALKCDKVPILHGFKQWRITYYNRQGAEIFSFVADCSGM